MSTFYLKARKVDDYTIVWDADAKKFFTEVTPKLASYSANNGYIYWDKSMGYGGTVTYEYIKYRDANGIIQTICQGEQVTCYDHTYQSSIGLAALPSGYNILSLLSKNKTNPYVEIKLTSGGFRTTETKYNSYLAGSNSFANQYPIAGTNDLIGVTYKVPSISSTSFTRNHAEKQYSLNMNIDYLDKYEVTITQINYDGNNNDKVSYTYSSTTKESTIKYSYLIEGTNKIDVVVWNGNNSITYSKTFTHSTPTVSNLVVTNTSGLIDYATTLTWESANQGKAEIVVNDIVIGSVTTAKTYIIPKGKLKVGANTIQVIVYNVEDSGVINSQVSVSLSKSITLSRITPTISNLAISGSNTDTDLKVSWESNNQSSYAILCNDVVIRKGIAEKSTLFAAGTLKTNYKSLKVIVYYSSGFDTIEAYQEIALQLTENTPIIYNLEPSDLNKNIDLPIVATFETNEFCDRWELSTSNGFISSGTVDKRVVYGAHTFSKGTNTLTLTTYYSPSWSGGSIIRKATKAVTFNGYGAPITPIISINEVCSTSTPTLSWNVNEEQIAYEYILLKGLEQIQTGALETTINTLTLSELTDKTDYTIKLRIKNKYGLYSEYATDSFSTLFNKILLPNFYLLERSNSVQITIEGHQESTFKSISVYRKDNFTSWLEIADNCNVEDSVIDYTLPCNTDISYKLRVYNTEGAYKDTEIKTINVSLINYWLTNIENLSESYRLDFVNTSYNFIRSIAYKQYSNQKAPRVFKGKSLYDVITMTAQLSNQDAYDFIKFIETANSYNIFCYRTWKGEKAFVSVILNGMNSVNSQVIEISLTLTQINFKEVKMYSGGGYRKLTYLNGEYFLDGTIDLSGYDDNVIKAVILDEDL